MTTKNKPKLTPQQEKEKRVRSELTKFRRLYRELPRDERTLLEKLGHEAAFMSATLEDLKEVVNRDGVVTSMPQGAYSIDRENPALRSYNAVIQRYNSTIKQMFDMLSKSSVENHDPRSMDDFIKKK
jgi:butyrate kinase